MKIASCMFIVMLFMSGCTTSYKAVSGENVAKITIFAPDLKNYNNANVMYIPDRSCINSYLMTNFFSINDSPYVTTLAPNVTVTIEIDFVRSSPDYGAGGSIIDAWDKKEISFISEPNAQYEIGFESSLSPLLYKVSQGERMKLTPLAKRDCY